MTVALAPAAGQLGVITRRPAVPLALALIGGIAASPYLPARPGLLLVLVAALALCSFILRRRPSASLPLFLAIATCGATAAILQSDFFPPDHIALFTGPDPRLAQLELRITSEPRLLKGGLPGRPALRQTCLAQVLAIRTRHGWTGAQGTISLLLGEPHPRLAAGQRLAALGMLQTPGPALNPGQFDWQHYYRSMGVMAELEVNRLGNIHIQADDDDSPFQHGLRWLHQSRHLLDMGFSPPQALDLDLLQAMLLGDKNPALRDVQQTFMRTGTAYHLNVSGLHIAILAGCVFLLGRLLCLRPRANLLITAAFTLLYGLVALPSYSSVRAMLLCAAALLAGWCGRATSRLQLLALAATAMLLYRPIDLFDAGFQLSFAAVLAMALLVPRLRQFFEHFANPHSIAAPRPQSPGPLALLIHWLRGQFWHTLLILLAIWLATLPLLASAFGQMNPWSVGAELLALPLVVVALIGGLLKMVFTLLWPSGAAAWAMLAIQPVAAMRWTITALARLPDSQLHRPPPTTALILLYYVLLAMPLFPWPRRSLRWAARLCPMAGCAAFLLGLGPRLTAPAQPGLKVTLLSIGAGQTAVIESPAGQVLLLDIGSSSIADLRRSVLQPFLDYENRPRVDTLYLSHGGDDHLSAAADTAEFYTIGGIYFTEHFSRHATAPDWELLDRLRELHTLQHLLRRGDHIDLGGGAALDILWPPPDGNFTANNASLVARLRFAGRAILFPSDIQDLPQRALLDDPAQLKSDVLVAPHQGGSELSTADFVAAVAPQWIVSSNAHRLSGKQKRFDQLVLKKYPLYRTDRCGAITVTITPQGQLGVETFLAPAVEDRVR